MVFKLLTLYVKTHRINGKGENNYGKRMYY